MGAVETELKVLDADGHVRRWKDLEREIVASGIARNRGNLSAAARQLRIGRATLYRMLGEHFEP